MLAERGVPAGTVIRAGFQSRGRGRIPGRVWSADAGGNLLFTLILSTRAFPFPVTRIPLLCGLALCRYFSTVFRLEPLIKWPNDVLIDEKKVSGILCEARGERILIGIGINCNQSSFLRISRKKRLLSRS